MRRVTLICFLFLFNSNGIAQVELNRNSIFTELTKIMKSLCIYLALTFLITNSVYSQSLTWKKDKDRKMKKIERIAADIDNDTLLIRILIDDSLIYGANIAFDEISETNRFKALSTNCFFMKDSVIVKMIYLQQTFYFRHENLILSYKRHEGYSDNTTQCCPITRIHYHYYWKSLYYSSFEIRNSDCNSPCFQMIDSITNKEYVDSLIEKLKHLLTRANRSQQ